jgi:hypothetical protein
MWNNLLVHFSERALLMEGNLANLTASMMQFGKPKTTSSDKSKKERSVVSSKEASWKSNDSNSLRSAINQIDYDNAVGKSSLNFPFLEFINSQNAEFAADLLPSPTFPDEPTIDADFDDSLSQHSETSMVSQDFTFLSKYRR